MELQDALDKGMEVASMEMEGKTIVEVIFIDDKNPSDPEGADTMLLLFDDSTIAVFEHYQNCCEHVSITDVCGDIQDLIGTPLLVAEEVSHYDDTGGNGDQEWTFYRFQTAKGDLVVRWFGESNGYYSTEVDYCIADFDTLQGYLTMAAVADIYLRHKGVDNEFSRKMQQQELDRLEAVRVHKQQQQDLIDKFKLAVTGVALSSTLEGYVLDTNGIQLALQEMAFDTTPTQAAHWFSQLLLSKELSPDEYFVSKEAVEKFTLVDYIEFIKRKGL